MHRIGARLCYQARSTHFTGRMAGLARPSLVVVDEIHYPPISL